MVHRPTPVMKIELIPATQEETPVLRRLMQLYLYDIASLDHWDIGEDGSYGNPVRIEGFWVDGAYDRFLIRIDGILAGFVLTSHESGDASEPIHVISEFFVLRRYRRAGVGRMAATRLFDGFDGTWKLSVMESNTSAREFWASVIGAYTGRPRREFDATSEAADEVIFRFRGGDRAVR